MDRLILFGGSFNPIHNGHLWMAQYAKEILTGEILFMPTGDSPHKEQSLEAKIRGKMVEKACKKNGFLYSDYEIKKEGICYTIDTISMLEERYPKARLYILMGEDSFLQLNKWKSYKKLFKKATIAVVPRYHNINSSIKEQSKAFKKYGAKIHFIPMPIIECSSTDIRKRVEWGQNIRNLVPDNILEYIKYNNIYVDENIREIRWDLEKNIGQKRFNHSLRVKDLSVQLAIKHNIDPDKVSWAAILHDCAKGIEDKLLKKSYYRERFTGWNQKKALWHGELGALYAEKKYGIKDKDILRAIRYHTTGRYPMSNLDKIIYIGDKIEPGRSDPKNPELRALAVENLDKAFYRVMDESIKYLAREGLTIHPYTKEIYMNRKDRAIDRN